jgi:hypothetical protein
MTIETRPIGVIIVQGEVEEIFEFPSFKALDIFGQGVSYTSDKYGGSAWIARLSDVDMYIDSDRPEEKELGKEILTCIYEYHYNNPLWHD